MRRPGSMARLLLGSALKKPVTTTYPAVRLEMPHRFRGKLSFQPGLCIGCRLCVRDCPTGAIEIRKVCEKRFEARIDFSRCIYCGQCVDVCPKGALVATRDFELAELKPEALKVVFPAEPLETSAPGTSPGAPTDGKP